MPKLFLAAMFVIAAVLTAYPSCAADNQASPSSGASSPPSAAFTAGIGRLNFLQGNWRLHPWQRKTRAGELVAGPAYSLPFQPIFSGRHLRATGQQEGTNFEMTLSFDERRNRYRLSLIDSISGVLDVYQGNFLDSGALRLENDHGFRFEFSADPKKGWVSNNYFSSDDGATWLLVGRYDASEE